MDLPQVGKLPSSMHELIHLPSLDIDPTKVDVNVHPTKSDVHFLNEDEVVEGIVAAVQSTLANANTSRTFTVQVGLRKLTLIMES